MKGHVETPVSIVDLMVAKLFDGKPPVPNNLILDPGCAEGAFIQGVITWCRKNKVQIPKIVGIELNPKYTQIARERFKEYSTVTIEQGDFLEPDERKFDYIIGNPPYVPITALSEEEKNRYRTRYDTARGRFDLYLLFFEKALNSLRKSGRLVFITPEKFLYVETAMPLRKLLSAFKLEEIQFLDEDVFGELVTYPTVTTVANEERSSPIRVILRHTGETKVRLPSSGVSWIPYLNAEKPTKSQHSLVDICSRISCGVATGADSIFVKETTQIDQTLRQFAYPTISGRELITRSKTMDPKSSMLIPYDRLGKLKPPEELVPLMTYLSQKEIKEHLQNRTCSAHKPWYAFHETPPLEDMLRPKILCKDITAEPYFWLDGEGKFVPRHTVYYIIPRDPSRLGEIVEFLNSDFAKKWLMNHCQHAANGYLRMQSHILKQLPVPEQLAMRSTITVAEQASRL